MELDTLKKMWQQREAAIESKATINRQLLDKIESQKIKSLMRPLLIKNRVILCSHLIFIVAILFFFVYHFIDFPYAASAAVLLLYYVYLTTNCLQQIKAIKNIDKGETIIEKQTALAELNSKALNIVRLSLLSIPVFLSFPVVVLRAFIDLKLNYFDSLDIVTHTNGKWWTVELIVSIVFIPAGIWFYNQLKPANMKRRWVNDIIRGATGKNVFKAAALLNEFNQLEKEN